MALWTFGQNNYHELGLGDVLERHVPTLVPCFETELVDVACGNEQTTVINVHGEVYAFGFNDSGQCGVGSTVRMDQPARLSALDHDKMDHVIAANGSEHTLAIAASGKLYSWGLNSHGQLGQDSAATSTLQPEVVTALSNERIMDGANSYFHSVLMTTEGQVYTFGHNEQMQLGTGDDRDRQLPYPVNYFASAPVMAVACGQHHTLASLRDGGVVGFGSNEWGQLGRLDTGYVVSEPRLLAAPLNQALVPHIGCGYFHSVAITTDGSVFTFGMNKFGQLGLGHKTDKQVPTLVQAVASIQMKQVACGSYHTLLLSSDGKVYPFGRNNHGQLGLETTVDCLAPQIIPALRNYTVTKVAAGYYHSACIVQDMKSDSQSGQQRSLGLDLSKLFKNAQYSDVTFVVEGKDLPAHRCIVGARCEPLERMLVGGMREESMSRIEIPDCSYDAFAILLEYLYTDRVKSWETEKMDTQLFLQVLALADQFLLVDLQRLCESMFTLSVDNVFEVFQAADFQEAHSLKKKCLAFILEHFGQVMKTEAFVNLPKPLMQEVLLTVSRNGVFVPKLSSRE